MKGFLKGPCETEEAFALRIQNLQPVADASWAKAQARTRELFGFAIDWVPLEYSNKKLPFWEGAATWISKNGPPRIQMREAFRKGKYLGYSRDEILAHESVHAARMAFDEPQFEEILAYQTSKSLLRRFLGPLFRRTGESALFMVAIFLSLFFWPALLLPAYFLLRLLRNQLIFYRCLKKYPLSFLVTLSDRDIVNLRN
jgi:hypothetical protein